MKPVLEVCTHSVESAVSAERGGAMRLELCANLMIGGTSPDEDLFRMVRERVSVPVRVLLRPRCGDFLYTESEFELLCRQVKRFAALGTDGIVIGVLTPEGDLDEERMAKLISLAGGCGVTLHRAFDVCRDPFAALETAKRLGVDTILTSGQQADCTAGADLLRALVAKAGEDMQILVGAGVNADVIRDLQPKTGANAFHLSAKRVENSRMQFRRENVPMGLPGLSEFSLWQCDENAVRAAREAFDACCGAGQEALHSDQLFDRFQQLITSIPLPHFLMSERIINHAKIALGKELSDSIYVTLPDHISAAVNRYKEGIVLPNPLLWDIRQLYKDEFRVGLKANEIVKEETGVEFTDDEAAFIALHFVNAQLGGEIRDIYDMTYLMKAVFGIVYDEYGFRPDHESLNYYRFVTHLKFYARRIVSGEKYGDEDADLLEVVRFKYPRAYACADRIRAYVQTEKGFHSGQNELLYLTIHIARVMEHPDEK